MLVHAGCSDLVYWCVTSLERAWNFHGTCISPASVRTHDSHDGSNMCRYRQHLQNLHETCVKPTSILHGTRMEPPGKLYQLEGAIQPPGLDTRDNGTYIIPRWHMMTPTSIRHGTCMKPHQNCIGQNTHYTTTTCRYRKHVRNLVGNEMETIGWCKSIANWRKLMAHKL